MFPALDLNSSLYFDGMTTSFREPQIGVRIKPGAVHAQQLVGIIVRLLEKSSSDTRRDPTAAVFHVPCLKPIDSVALRAALSSFERVVTVEEHSRIGGLGGLIAEELPEEPGAPRIVRLGIDDTWGESAPNDFLLAKHGLSVELISESVARSVAS